MATVGFGKISDSNYYGIGCSSYASSLRCGSNVLSISSEGFFVNGEGPGITDKIVAKANKADGSGEEVITYRFVNGILVSVTHSG